MSKGDTPRPVDKEKYGKNFDRIFRKEKESEQKPTKTPQGSIGISGPEFEKEFDICADLNSKRTTGTSEA